MNDITNINSNRSQLSPNQSSSVKGRNEAKQSNQDESSSAAGDRVTLTNTASRLQNIEQQLNSASSIDSARVSEVQSAITMVIIMLMPIVLQIKCLLSKTL